VGTLTWFRDHGGYQQLLDYYQKAPWVTKIGSGAYIQYGDFVDWRGGLYAVQSQLNFFVHAGYRLILPQKTEGQVKPFFGNFEHVAIYNSNNENLTFFYLRPKIRSCLWSK
jgi:Transcriptional regulator, AbiEi antitoxin N-terminal domain